MTNIILPRHLYAALVSFTLAGCATAIATPQPTHTVQPATATVPPATPTPEPTLPADVAPARASGLTGRIVSDNFEDIFVMNADGTGLTQLTTDPGNEFDGEWSPDGTKIVYRDSTRGINKDDEIFVMNADGSGKTNLTNDPANDWGPTWSPDGTQIAFNSDRQGGPPGLHIMNADGSNVRHIGDGWIEYPDWSPDGTRFVFMGARSGSNYEIYVINADGSGLAQLTDAPGEEGWPVWSPDGTQIAFTSQRDDCRFSSSDDCKTTGDIGPFHSIYVMNADGTDQHRVADVFGQFMGWSPDGHYILFGSSAGTLIVNPATLDLARIEVAGQPAGYFAHFVSWTNK